MKKTAADAYLRIKQAEDTDYTPMLLGGAAGGILGHLFPNNVASSIREQASKADGVDNLLASKLRGHAFGSNLGRVAKLTALGGALGYIYNKSHKDNTPVSPYYG